MNFLGHKVKREVLKFQEQAGLTLYFSEMEMTHFEIFLGWMHQQNWNINYISRYIRILKKFFQASFDEGIHKNTIFKHSAFHVPNFKSNQVFLDMEELDLIAQLDLSKAEKRTRNVRDLFLIGAWTGLRISDYGRMGQENIVQVDGERFIYIPATTKTHQELYLPLHPKIKSIVEQRQGNWPERIGNLQFNRKIKWICKKAGIDHEVEKISFSGGSIQRKKYKKHELVSSHTARRSFCTNALLAGIDSVDVMAMSGHKKVETFRLYVRADQLRTAKKLNKHPFFKAQKA